MSGSAAGRSLLLLRGLLPGSLSEDGPPDCRTDRAKAAIGGIWVGAIAAGDERSKLGSGREPREADHEGRNRHVVHGDELGEVPGCIKPEPIPRSEDNEQKQGAQ